MLPLLGCSLASLEISPKAGSTLAPSRSILWAVAGVAELVDALDLGSCALRRGGSTPPFRTTPLFHLLALMASLR